MSVQAAQPDDSAPGPAPRRRRGRSPRQLQETMENRRAIVHSAVEFFARYGYTKTTLHAVAERVGLTRTGLLHHFQSKEGLLTEAIAMGKEWADAQAKLSGGVDTGLEGIRSLYRFLGTPDDGTYVRFVQTLQAEALHDDVPDQVRTYVQLRLGQMVNYVTRCLEEARANGEIGDVDVPALVTLIVGTVNGLQVRWLLDSSIDMRAALDALVELLAATRPDGTLPTTTGVHT